MHNTTNPSRTQRNNQASRLTYRMPTLTPDEVRLREDLCRKYRIVFAGETRPSEWPDRHKRTLQQVCELGNRKYDTYTDSPEQGDYEPWRAERKSMATVLTQIAARFHRRNESSWRHACEPIILGRLSAEVCWYAYPPLLLPRPLPRVL